VSLVERAVKRLEELGRANPQAPSGESSMLPADADGLVERAVRQLAAQTEEIASVPPLPGRQQDETIRPGATQGQAGLQRSVGAGRRDPTLGESSQRETHARVSTQTLLGGAPPSPAVKLNIKQLAASGFIDVDDPESIVANDFRGIKRPLIRACQGRLATPVVHANRIMVTSSVPGEGKSFVSLNLALSMAMERELSVLLVDADTTRRSLSIQMGVGAAPGLLDLLTGEHGAPESAVLRTNVERLSLLPAGALRPRATELLASDQMERLVEELASSDEDRILIFDSPPLLGAPEPAALATRMGQIIVVVEADKTTRKVLENALATIQSCPRVTAILNKASRAEVGYDYGAARP